jgi:hypothetical protein
MHERFGERIARLILIDAARDAWSDATHDAGTDAIR